ncbi:MAG: sigma-70 family RNA polymerase sigma factor [Bacteroidales bacterium]|nr:sigma-70 family RNA polymerase sigma factor [Bacteroidales bacterium]
MNGTEYNRCVDEYSDALYAFMLKSTKDEELARDLVQESFMRLWEHRHEVEKTKSKSYLFTIGYHAMIDHIRKHKRVEAFNDKYHTQITHNDFSDLKEVLNKAVDNLPEDQKSVLLLRDYEGYSYKEIGEITGLTESQVKVYIFRARLFLKNYIVHPDYVV